MKTISSAKSIPLRPNKISHLFMNSKGLKKVNNLAEYRNLRVLYLHNNHLSSVGNFGLLQNLTHLYLQWNKLKSMPDLRYLPNLKKLYIGKNYISSLNGLMHLPHLDELHIDRQNITSEFQVDPTCALDLSKSLTVLNVTCLNLKNLVALQCFQNLRVLLASENNFPCAEELAQILGKFPVLEVVELQGCPAQKDSHYREKIIAGSSPALKCLDGKMIPEMNRSFIKRFEQIKLERKIKSEISTTKLNKDKKRDVDVSNSVFLFNDPNKKPQVRAQCLVKQQVTRRKKARRKACPIASHPALSKSYTLKGKSIIW